MGATYKSHYPLALIAALAFGPTSNALAQPTNMGLGISMVWAPAYIATDQKLWQRQGLEPKVIYFPSGRAAQEALVGGGVIWSTVAESPTVFAALSNLPVRVIGSMNAYDCHELAAVKAIATIKDLKGKKIGYAKGTNAHVLFARMLEKAGLKISDVTAISLSPGDYVSSLSNGQIHGFVWTEPHLSQAVALNPAKYHRIHERGLYKCYHNIVTTQSTIDKNPDALVKVLRAMMDAVDYIKANPASAIAITAKAVKLDEKLAAAAWKDMPFEIDLDADGLVAEMEKQAKWAIEAGLARPDAKIPNFRDYVVTGFIKKARQK